MSYVSKYGNPLEELLVIYFDTEACLRVIDNILSYGSLLEALCEACSGREDCLRCCG